MSCTSGNTTSGSITPGRLRAHGIPKSSPKCLPTRITASTLTICKNAVSCRSVYSLLSSKPLLREKNVRPGFQEKSGRHIGLKRPYVLGHFEVKQEIWGCLATFLGTVKRRFFLFRYAQAFCDTKRWTSALRNRENCRDIPDFQRRNSAPRVICAWRKGRQKPCTSLAH